MTNLPKTLYTDPAGNVLSPADVCNRYGHQWRILYVAGKPIDEDRRYCVRCKSWEYIGQRDDPPPIPDPPPLQDYLDQLQERNRQLVRELVQAMAGIAKAAEAAANGLHQALSKFQKEHHGRRPKKQDTD